MGTAETFSKIKSQVKLPNQAIRPLTSSSTARLKRVLTKTASYAKFAYKLSYHPRLLVHGAVVTGVALVILSAQMGTSASKAELLSRYASAPQTADSNSALDTMSAAGVAAKVATGTSSLVSADATATASNLSSQVALAASDEAYLAKRQVVPTATSVRRETISYTVKGGDTLSTIATQFNITTNTVRWANNIDDVDNLKPGQVLSILPTSGLRYKVKAGDTAESIAAQFQSVAAQILSFNDAEVKGLVAGQDIIVPDGVKAEAAAATRAQAPAVGAPAQSSSYAPSLTQFAFGGNSYTYGQCTYYVASRRSIPAFWGNANSWYYNAQASGFSVGSVPIPGAIAWTGAGYAGHVAYVESVSGGMVTISEMNYGGNWNRVTYRTVPASSFRYIY